MSDTKPQRTYLTGVKPWKIRNMVEGYLQARYSYQQVRRGKISKRHMPSFEALKEISETLYEVKEDHHAIFRLPDEPAFRNGNNKFVPGYAESTFIDHVGLLFHKVMVARELRYILERYAHDERNWEVHFNQLEANLERIDQLFDDGVEIISNLVRTHSDNVLLLAFLMEHYRWVGKCLDIQPNQLMKELVTKLEPAQAYYQVAEYYFESGWFKWTANAAKKCMKVDPDNERARLLLQKVEEMNKN